MKIFMRCIHGVFVLLLCTLVVRSQEATAVDDEAAEGLDLKAVGEVFREAKNLEDFEKALNDPDEGINNLDLDRNGEVDFIRIVEQNADDTRLVIMQAVLGDNEFQDVATIEVDKNGSDDYNMQIRGNEVVYGPNFYIVPTVRIHAFPVITWMYGPLYRPYVSGYRIGVYPRWWRPFRPVTVHVYRTRTVRYTRATTFSVSHTSRVTTVHKVQYKPRTSTVVKSKTTVTRSRHGKTTVKKSTTTTRRRR